MENEKKHDDGGMDHPELYTSFIYYLVLWSPACAMVCLILYLLSFIQRFNILYRKRFGHQYNVQRGRVCIIFFIFQIAKN